MKENNNKKICMIASMHPVRSIRIFQKQAKSLLHAGWDVLFIVQHEKEEVLEGIRIVPIRVNSGDYSNQKMKLKYTAGRISRIWEAYKKAIEVDADIYHLHEPELIITGHLLKRRGKKIIQDFHEDHYVKLWDIKWLPKITLPILKMFYDLLNIKFVSEFDGVVSAWPSIHESYLKKGFNSILVRNYPDLSINKKINIKKESNKIVYAGAISEARGIREIVKAMDLLANKGIDVSLELCGRFKLPELEEEIKNSPGWERVNYHGFVSRSEANKIMNKCLAGLIIFHPIKNHLHSQPNKLFEYMAVGLPSIASKLPMLESIIEKEKCGFLIDPFDPNDIAEAIEYIINNKKESEVMGNRGRNAVKNNYNWQNEKNKLIALYKQLYSN